MKKYAKASPTARPSPGKARSIFRINSRSIRSAGAREARKVRAIALCALQHEDTAVVVGPVLEPCSAGQEQRELELHVRPDRRRERTRAKCRQRPCHRPHAVGNGTLE